MSTARGDQRFTRCSGLGILPVFLLQAHPSVRPAADELSYARITAKEVAEFHKRMFVGQNMIVTVAGDVDPVAASKTLPRRSARYRKEKCTSGSERG